MSATIVISSSPPLFWARDPTPVTMLPPGSQSNSRSPDTYCSPKRFKTTPAIRDSFSHGFSSARALLVKPGVENLPLRSTPPKDRFKTTLPSPKRRSPPFIDNRSRSDVQLSESVTRSLVNDPLPEEAVQEAAAQHTPCRLERAVSRKMDWTPVADDQETEDASDSDLFARGESARAGLMNSFGFKSTGLSSNIIPNVAIKQSAVKRRKLDLVDVAGPIIQKAEKRKGRTVAPKKSKASVKKAKTITDLVTSHHKGKLANESMLADYLVASQARMVDGPASDDNIDVATTSKRRRTATKAGKGKKSKLLSPTSAIKTVEQQQTMFGSLSQLARDEPVVEADLSSDPVSPLRTQPISIESTTPRLERGTSRFVRTRNLWGAAERDENNALVFTENLDLVHSPVTDVPLTGQNVVVHSGPTLSAVRLDRSGAVAMCSKFPIASPSRAYHTFAVLDVDDLSSPADGNATVTESNHFAGGDAAAGASGSGRPLGTSRGTAGDSSHDVMPGDRPSGMTLPSVPKPRYAGMHTDDLKKAIQDYGFKPIRSRQKMIEKLEECWDQKEARRVAKVTQPDATQTVAMKQSDIISDVHALSARPVPKSKTPKVKAAGAKAPASPKEPKKRKRAAAATMDGIEVTNPALSATKEPRKRKSTVCDAAAQSDADETVSKGKARQKPTPKKSNKDEPQKPKKPRGRPKAASVPQAAILDVDDIDDDFTNLTMIREEKEKQKARLKAIESEMLTPPATLHISESKAFVPAASESADAGEAPEPGIGRQIQAAILYQSKEAAGEQGRDHIRDPSWHEKILMYDPIVLEDLARWLNAEGLAKVKEDREVTTLDVRSWCESKGICCLWKGGWRGQGTKNGSD